MIKTGKWSTEFELEPCEGDYVPDIFNFRWVRHGGRLGYATGEMTVTLKEVKSLHELFSKSLEKHRKRVT